MKWSIIKPLPQINLSYDKFETVLQSEGVFLPCCRFDGGSENNFTEVSTDDDDEHPVSLLVSSKSVSESDQIVKV